MAVHTLSSGTKRVPYMPLTIEFIPCPAPVLQSDFDSCRIPGGLELWANGGFYSPGECFTGYYARCTQTAPVSSGWPIQKEETVVRCIPETKDQRYAVSNYDGTILSAPAFEIRWRSADVSNAMRSTEFNPPGAPTPRQTSTVGVSTSSFITTSEVLTTQFTSSLPTSSTPTESTSSNASDSPALGPSLTLSPGTIAGVTIGSCLGLLAVASAITFLFLRRRRRYQGPRRLTEDTGTWGQQDAHKDATELPVSQRPAELENKSMELRELPVEPRLSSQELSQMWRAGHISVNAIPVEVAADPAPNARQAAERKH
ncbi:hypothetical protein A9Z42_0071150 [Trichoderma parareesei]|uniref:Uncharacterized protein n=1 Tax=Trichoderma parareesei TaxID=858221 RepID=A0A2H2ZWM2_TRIPA|nr:hypothetical protein A9Z42_0071150 [Trichoderma parareesei]